MTGSFCFSYTYKVGQVPIDDLSDLFLAHSCQYGFGLGRLRSGGAVASSAAVVIWPISGTWVGKSLCTAFNSLKAGCERYRQLN